ncbi:MAG: copper resistance system multicopper oxidase [Pseudomonadota bacterium]|nr:copper resistance system multicopper oxidase [Pseudomonadota bacterium]
MTTRRRFLERAAATGGLALTQGLIAPWARSAALPARPEALEGNRFDLAVSRAKIAVDGRGSNAILINGQLPAPLLRWREGDEVTLHVRNNLDVDTSIHWHGVLLPFEMDGVPGISFPGIKPGETFTYRFPVKQAGTYWYHSHSGLQEQSGHYGPIIIDPKGADPVAYDREHVVVLSDWIFADPERLFAKLKKNSEALNFQKRTVGDFIEAARTDGVGAAFADRAMWGGMRMDPTDIADVGGHSYAYLVNGRGPRDNWTGLFAEGERVRLRIVNASAMTIFNLRIPDLAMTVVQADGQDVEPVETDEIQIGVAETYDVVVRPDAARAYTLMAETIDRSGYARATLAPLPGMDAPVPPLRARPVLTMKDMAMDHGGMAMGAMEMGAMDHGAMDHGSMSHDAQTHDHPTGAGVDMVAAAPSNRLAEPGIGLENVGHRVLTYADLKSLRPNPDRRAPGRELELHLTGNMRRYMWSFDGEKFSEVETPIMFHEGERLRLTLVNDTMMSHPIHLHGMFFDVVTREDARKPRKHTIVVKPGEKLSVDVTADAPGDWAFHCHLLYHMVAGMMRTVSVMAHGPRTPSNDVDSGHGEHDARTHKMKMQAEPDEGAKAGHHHHGSHE